MSKCDSYKMSYEKLEKLLEYALCNIRGRHNFTCNDSYDEKNEIIRWASSMNGFYLENMIRKIYNIIYGNAFSFCRGGDKVNSFKEFDDLAEKIISESDKRNHELRREWIKKNRELHNL